MDALPLTAREAARLARASVPGLGLSCDRLRLDDGTVVTVAAGRSDIVRALGCAEPLDAVIVIGAFDGIHLGHQALVRSAARDAVARGVSCVAVTFDPDPADVLVGLTALTRLLDIRNRERGLVAAGVDAVVTIPFTTAVAAMDYEGFLSRRLAPLMRIAAIHVGSDFRLGRGGAGTVEALASYGATRGIDVVGHPLVTVGDVPVTATRIRACLAAGDVEGASLLLGRPHIVRGVVEHGRGEGTTFGFPTANVRCDGATCMPRAGVYGAFALLDADIAYAAAVNVGAPPTFATLSDPAFLEANLVGFSGNLYSCSVSVAFCTGIRTAHRFDSVEELERAVEQNIYWVKCNLGSRPIPLGGGL